MKALNERVANKLKAIVEMTRKIRKRTHQTGLILANGGLLTYQHVLCLSSMPRKDGLQYPLSDTHQPTLAKGLTQPPFDGTAEGEATIEVWLPLLLPPWS